MAGVLSRHSFSEESQRYIPEYFRRHKDNHRESNGSDASTDTRTKSPRDNGRTSKCGILGIVTDKPKYRNYCFLNARIASFEGWPKNKTQDVKELAKAGFVYTGMDDSVRCFFCGIGLRDWPQNACPWEQHVIASPKCGHVAQCKGTGYVRKVLDEDNGDSDVDDSVDVIDTVNIAINRNRDAVTAARDFCTDEYVLRLAIKSLIKLDIQKKFSAVELVECIQQIEERKSGEVNSDGEQYHTESDDDIEEANRQLKENVTCKICYDSLASVIVLPCGHMICCPQCVSALTKCAICRIQIKGTVRAIMAA